MLAVFWQTTSNQSAPILVGSSVAVDEHGNPRRTENTPFAEAKDFIATADDREAASIGPWLAQVTSTPSFPEREFREQLLGFDALLGTIDHMVLLRDGSRLGEMRAILESRLRSLENDAKTCSEDLAEVGNIGQRLERLAAKLVGEITSIQFPDGGHAQQALMAGKEVLDALGMTLADEEIEFMEKVYIPNADYTGQPMTFHSQYISDEATTGAWLNYIVGADIPLVDFPSDRLVTGDLYGRTQSAWATHVYKFIRPSKEDREKLLSLHGFDHEMAGDNAIKRAKRLGEMYANQLRPAIDYFCQRVVFIIEKIFNAAWSLIQRDVVEAKTLRVYGETEQLGKDLFAAFSKTLREFSAKTFSHVFADLDCEITKLFPYQEDSPSVQGLLRAFPGKEKEIAERIHEYLTVEKPKLLSSFAKLSKKKRKTFFAEGVKQADELLRFAGQHPISRV